MQHIYTNILSHLLHQTVLSTCHMLSLAFIFYAITINIISLMIIHIHPAIFGTFDVNLWKLKRMRDKGLFDVKVEKYIEKIKKNICVCI